MIEISRKNRKHIIIEEATTVKEAVEYAVKNRISLEGADLHNADLREADLRGSDLYCTDLTGADLRDTNLREANLFHSYLFNANLSNADLSYANLSNSDVRGADLTGANLSGANIDYSCLPLWCGSLNMKIDKKIFCQLLYHVLRAGKSVKDEEVQKIISNPENITMANQFHRVEECGKI